MARKFFYVAAGMFLLALSFHFGFTTATAQGPGNSVVSLANEGTGGYVLAVTAQGDLYRAQGYTRTYSFEHVGNVFSSVQPIPAQRATFGQVKARYAPNPQTPTSQTNDR